MRHFLTSILITSAISAFAAEMPEASVTEGAPGTMVTTKPSPAVTSEDFATAPDPVSEDYAKRRWSLSVQGGPVLAFGDDSYDIFKDFKEAWGPCLSVSAGYSINRIFSTRVRMRYLHMYSRMNLEVYEANLVSYPDVVRRRGFYGYNAFSMQAEGSVDLCSLLRKSHRPSSTFHLYLDLGVGFNVVGGYDDRVELWTEEAGVLTGSYPVDTRTHTMPTASIGGTMEFRLSPSFSLNLSTMCTFTGDKLEGVKYEESYDAYVNAMVGFTTYF